MDEGQILWELPERSDSIITLRPHRFQYRVIRVPAAQSAQMAERDRDIAHFPCLLRNHGRIGTKPRHLVKQVGSERFCCLLGIELVGFRHHSLYVRRQR